MKNFGPMFRNARLRYSANNNGIKAFEVAERLGVSGSYLSEIEHGKRQPSLDMLSKFCELYGELLPVEQMFDKERKAKNGT